ncbi:MAG: uncharacterized protein K0S48_39 [Ramlibacter sp.]|jgi:hypothetical protein|nr:uncharacterized protein [Ramlibacter sp.]
MELNIAFNWRMETPEHPDWALVTALGGPVKVAEILGWTKDGSVQRVQNWKTRGIPPAVKLERPDLFLPALRRGRARAGHALDRKAA